MVTLLSNAAPLRKAVKDALAPRSVTARRVTPKEAGVLGHADAVVTTTDLNASVERLAMRVGTGFIFVLPEAAEALAGFVDNREDVVLVGHDLGKIDSLVRAEMTAGEQTVIL